MPGKINIRILAEGNLNSLTLSERTHIAENRQVMKAYLISKLVAPKYQIEDGKINMQKNVGHLDRFEHYNRQSAMFDLVFNGQITVDTRATKKQQREAIKRLKKSSKDRHLEKQEKVRCQIPNLKLSEFGFSNKPKFCLGRHYCKKSIISAARFISRVVMIRVT
jgi:hypothetical protein